MRELEKRCWSFCSFRKTRSSSGTQLREVREAGNQPGLVTSNNLRGTACASVNVGQILVDSYLDKAMIGQSEEETSCVIWRVYLEEAVGSSSIV
ncbi:hypothetical protein CALCODRAFT_84954 [Calocera cornea HHB12733]|uniref:Uncharacterized protein n=1 Tax=Calocera cornea HHB12733 TaxID=1353952 RepID=A0A165IN96_9BASI|nr:hypothetical protein CALCODRAFT_84954 [Calocera cornea HHB12733]